MTRRWRLRLIIGAYIVLATSVFPATAETAHPGTVLPGGSSGEPINIDAAKLDYFEKEQKLVYSGNVVATQGESRLKAGTLVIFLSPRKGGGAGAVPSSSSQVRRMEATGPVTIISKDQIGTGDTGVYEGSENKVYLVGNVTLTQGPNVTKGDKLVYDLSNNQAAVIGKVRSMFVPGGGSGNARESAATRSAATTKPDHAAGGP
jgi:lipopolysaccharide export system protein LptA